MTRHGIMRCLAWICLAFVVMAAKAAPEKVEGVIRDKAYGFDRSELEFYKWAKPKENKKRGQLTQCAGWIEYDFKATRTGWHELWYDNFPTAWQRDIYIDGQPVLLDVISRGEDQIRQGRTQWLKEANLFLTAGKHRLRFERTEFPGIFPMAWELRPAGASAEGCLRATYAGTRLLPPGATVTLPVLGGTASETQYEFILENLATGETTPAGALVFETTERPVEKSIQVTFPAEGLYSMRAKLDGKLLRPSDLKAGPFVISKVAAKKEEKPALRTPTKLDLGGPFSNNAILQRDVKLPVWGWAAPGTNVTVKLASAKAATSAGGDGRWQVEFPPHKAGGPFKLVVTAGDKQVISSNVMFGDVWIFGGQSNMGGPLLKSTNGPEAAAKANFPDVRLSIVFPNPPGDPDPLRNFGWAVGVAGKDGGKKTFRRWNAIPFAFGTTINRELGVPVGLVVNNRGGTAVATWTSMKKMKETPEFKPQLDKWRMKLDHHLIARNIANRVCGSYTGWKNKTDRARAQGKPAPKPFSIKQMVSRAYSSEYRNEPASLYNHLVAPLAPLAVKGVNWYQGESDSKRAYRYRTLFPAMIANWRELLGRPDLPFLFVQIAPGSGDIYTGPPAPSKSAELREAQLMSRSVPHTAMVVSHDLPVPGDNVHYLNKLPVGRRLALAVLGTVYGRDVVWSGPMYKKMTVEGNKARLHFDHVHGGLVAKGDKLGGFMVAGPKKIFHWAEATIDGDTVLVRHDRVKKPVAVRYAWCDDGCGANLYNKAGLPAPTFRTDDWPGCTIDGK